MQLQLNFRPVETTDAEGNKVLQTPKSQILEFDKTTAKSDIGGIILEGYASLSFQIASINQKNPIESIVIDEQNSKAVQTDIRSNVPSVIALKIEKDTGLDTEQGTSRSGKTVEQKVSYVVSMIKKYATEASLKAFPLTEDVVKEIDSHFEKVSEAVKAAQEYLKKWVDDSGKEGSTVIEPEFYIKKSDKVRKAESNKK